MYTFIKITDAEQSTRFIYMYTSLRLMKALNGSSLP